MKRPEGYEGSVASRMIEKEGATDALRDALAVMYACTLYASHVTSAKRPDLPA